MLNGKRRAVNRRADLPTRAHGGGRKDGAKTYVARDVSVEAVKHSSFFQNGRHRVTAPRANLSDDEFHKVKC